jgi:prevent-host-death family protein
MAAHPKTFAGLAAKPTVKKPRLAPLKPAPLKVAARPSTQRVPVAAAKAKTHFLQLLDEVARERQPITITKRGRIVAQLIPASEPVPVSAFDQVFGRMAGTMKITGDIVSPDWEAWGPEWR